MKITVLTGLEKPDPKSYDVVADQVAAALAKKGHKTTVLGVYDDVRKLVSGIARRKPDLIFNLLESFGGQSTAGDFVPYARYLPRRTWFVASAVTKVATGEDGGGLPVFGINLFQGVRRNPWNPGTLSLVRRDKEERSP